MNNTVASVGGFFEAFWQEVEEVWQTGFFGLDFNQIALALGVFLIFLILRRYMARGIALTLGRLVKKTKTELDDELLKAIQGPLTLLPIALGLYFASQIAGAENEFGIIALQTTQSLIAIAIFWALANAVMPLKPFLQPLGQKFSPVLVEWLVTGFRYGFMGVGIISVLQVWNIPVVPILASFSLLSVAIALGAQDLFKNLIAGALIIAERRFVPGDWIKVDGVVEGVVEKVYFRSTKVRQFDQAPVYVPNSELSEAAVVNYNEMPARRISWTIGLEYRTTAEQISQVVDGIRYYLTQEAQDTFVQQELPLFVRVESFAASSIDVMVYCFTRTTVWSEWLKAKEDLAYRIKEIVEGAGAGFAFPSQSLYLESLPQGSLAAVFDEAQPANDPQEAGAPLDHTVGELRATGTDAPVPPPEPGEAQTVHARSSMPPAEEAEDTAFPQPKDDRQRTAFLGDGGG